MPKPTGNREELIASFAGKLFSAMLEEVVMDAALQSHKDIVRSRAVCEVCGTRCGSAHAQRASSNGAGPSTSAGSTAAPVLPPGSPAPAGKTIAGMNTPTSKDKNDGNIYFECTNCQKKIASNRYAPHLSSCLGIGAGSRRGAARNAAARNKLSAETDRPGSPFVGSDYGSPSHDAINGKGKGKTRNGKKFNGKVVDAELNGNHKRPITPDGPPRKKNKKQNTSTTDTDATIFDNPNSRIPTAAKIPVKPGTTSTPPYAPGSSTGSGASASQYSGRDSPSASGSGSSFNAQSPSASRGSTKPPKTYKTGVPSKRRGRPPGSGKNHIAASAEPQTTPATWKPEEKEEDQDFVDVDGEGHGDSSSDSS